MIYIDDASPDGTADLVEEYVRAHGKEERFTLVRNKTNQNEVANTYYAVQRCDDNEIVFRGDWWRASLMHSYYAWLFKLIKPEDLMHEGSFIPRSGDTAILLPILEMSGWHHHYIPEVCYIWNRETPINEDKVDPQGQDELEEYIWSLPRYERLRAPVKN